MTDQPTTPDPAPSRAERIEEALWFYATPDSWCVSGDTHEGEVPVFRDGGEIARSALAAPKEDDALRERAEKAERERDEARALLREASLDTADALHLAQLWSDDDQVGCLCIDTCYCRVGRLSAAKAEHTALLARIDAVLREKGAGS